MKKLVLISLMALIAVTSYGRKRIENATVVGDTIYYAENMQTVTNRNQASYYRLLMTQGKGFAKEDVFQDFYMNGKLKAEGGYTFVDLSNDMNTVLNGEVTTYYKSGKEKLHGTYKNGKREGYFTLQLREGGVAVVQYANGKSVHNYFTVTLPDGTMEQRPLSEIANLLD